MAIDLARPAAAVDSLTFLWDFLEAYLIKVKGCLILCCWCVVHLTVPDSPRIVASIDSQTAYIAVADEESFD